MPASISSILENEPPHDNTEESMEIPYNPIQHPDMQSLTNHYHSSQEITGNPIEVSGQQRNPNWALVTEELFAKALTLAKKYSNNAYLLPEEETIPAAIDALVQATERYDPTQGVEFETWVTTRVWQRLIDKGRRERHRQLNEVQLQDTDDFLSDESLDPAAIFEKKTRYDDLHAFLATIEDKNPREAKIARLYYGLNENGPIPVKQIAEELGVSYKAVESTLSRFREHIRNGYTPPTEY